MEKKFQTNYLGLLLLGLSLSVGFIVSAAVMVKGAKAFAEIDQRITVKGYAEKMIVSDLGEWSGTITTRLAPDLKTAYQWLQDDVDVALAFFKKRDINQQDLTFHAVTIHRQYKLNKKGMATHDIEGVRLSQAVTFRSDDVNKVKQIATDASGLIEQNIYFKSENPRYTFSKTNDLKLDMLAKATKNARQRALRLVEGSGNKLGTLRSGQQGVFQITAPNSTSVSGYGVFDTSTIDKVIKAIVTIEYTIE